jgi:hypothetical protein
VHLACSAASRRWRAGLTRFDARQPDQPEQQEHPDPRAHAAFSSTSSSFGAACGSTCSTVFTPIPGADHQQADRSTYLRRAASTDPITLATIEGAAACTIGDNPGSAALEVWVR